MAALHVREIATSLAPLVPRDDDEGAHLNLNCPSPRLPSEAWLPGAHSTSEQSRKGLDKDEVHVLSKPCRGSYKRDHGSRVAPSAQPGAIDSCISNVLSDA